MYYLKLDQSHNDPYGGSNSPLRMQTAVKAEEVWSALNHPHTVCGRSEPRRKGGIRSNFYLNSKVTEMKNIYSYKVVEIINYPRVDCVTVD